MIESLSDDVPAAPLREGSLGVEERLKSLEELESKKQRVDRLKGQEQTWRLRKKYLALTPAVVAGAIYSSRYGHNLDRTERAGDDVYAMVGGVWLLLAGSAMEKLYGWRARKISKEAGKISTMLAMPLPHAMQESIDSKVN